MVTHYLPRKFQTAKIITAALRFTVTGGRLCRFLIHFLNGNVIDHLVNSFRYSCYLVRVSWQFNTLVYTIGRDI